MCHNNDEAKGASSQGGKFVKIGDPVIHRPLNASDNSLKASPKFAENFRENSVKLSKALLPTQ